MVLKTNRAPAPRMGCQSSVFRHFQRDPIRPSAFPTLSSNQTGPRAFHQKTRGQILEG